ncbi:hypothetical protein TEQG_05582 [Trichophyton equinum CBS 127.97]|uniref:Uncharacterized protein n=1 Tax=Trichophyton equinum (strain ATCC MYA-4606 / CBS 127.97) TaxID=559882 RepID=F2PXG6_TRIEC|nr:hypothetical protein TEQG_05582 [Trichophyton equinum CBS 127.97]
MARHALELEAVSSSGPAVLHHGLPRHDSGQPSGYAVRWRLMVDARDGASPSGSAGGAVGLSALAASSLHPSTAPGGNLGIQGGQLYTANILSCLRTGFDGVDRRDRGRIRREAGGQQPKTTPERRTLFNLRAPPDGDHLHCLGYAELMMPWPEYILPLVRESDIHNSLWRTGGAARSCNSPTATPATESTSLQLTRTLFDDYSV